MAGPVLGDPAWAPPLPAGETFLGWADRAPGRLRIGRFRESADAGRRAGAGGADGVRRRLDAARRASATTWRTCRPACSGPRCCRRSSGSGRCRGRRCRCRPTVSATCGRSPGSCGRAGLALSAQDAMEAMFGAAAVLPAVPAGDGAVRRPARAGLHHDAAAAGLVRRGRRRRGGLRTAEAVRGVHRAVQRHRPARGQRSAVLDGRPGCRSARCSWGARRTRPPCSRCRRSWRRRGRGRTGTPTDGTTQADRRACAGRLSPVNVAETILVFAGIPLAIIAVMALLIFVPGGRKRPRYKSGSAVGARADLVRAAPRRPRRRPRLARRARPAGYLRVRAPAGRSAAPAAPGDAA